MIGVYRNLLNKINFLVFVSLIVSLIVIFFVSGQTSVQLKAVQSVLGFFVVFFPTGWLLMAFIFPKEKEISLLSRFVFSIALSIAVNSIAMEAIFYSRLPVPLNFKLNIFLQLFFGVIFFAGWFFRVRREHE